MSGPRKKAPKTIAVIDPDRCFGAFACSICQAACPVAGLRPLLHALEGKVA